MTAEEKNRMLLLVRAVESLFSETCALKTVLAAHRIPRDVWKKEANRLLTDPELSTQLHAKFQHLYDAIEKTPDETQALEELLKALELPKTKWN